jgi:ketosteroid isomerase-like protein
MSEENVEALRKAYDDFNNGNPGTVVAMMADDVEWTEPGGGNAPSGTFNSPDSVQNDVFGPIGETFDEFVCTPEDFNDEGDTVTATGRFSGKNKNGAELDAKFTHRFEMQDGKIKRFDHQVDEGWAAAWS